LPDEETRLSNLQIYVDAETDAKQRGERAEHHHGIAAHIS
jgi:hypothetical protein